MLLSKEHTKEYSQNLAYFHLNLVSVYPLFLNQQNGPKNVVFRNPCVCVNYASSIQTNENGNDFMVHVLTATNTRTSHLCVHPLSPTYSRVHWFRQLVEQTRISYDLHA